MEVLNGRCSGDEMWDDRREREEEIDVIVESLHRQYPISSDTEREREKTHSQEVSDRQTIRNLNTSIPKR